MSSEQRQRVIRLLGMAKALRISMESSVRAAAADDVWKYSSFDQFARKYNDIVTSIGQILRLDAPLDLVDLDKMPRLGDSYAMVQKQYFETIHANLSMLIAYVEDELGITQDKIENLKNFFQARLRQVVFVRPDAELEIQNAIEQLLVGRGDTKGIDYDRETGRTMVSGKESVPDFIFPRLSVALEVKLAKERARLGTLVDQMNADIASYSTQYSQIIFVIYDLGTIRDEVEFRSGLEKCEHVSVIITKH